MKKIISSILSVILLFSILVIMNSENVYASDVKNADVLVLDSLSEVEEKAIISCEAELNNSSELFKVHIDKDSIVRFDYTAISDGNYWNFALYSNQALTSEIKSKSCYATSAYSGDTSYVRLREGDYYVQLSSEYSVSSRISITAVPVENVFDIKVSKNKISLVNNYTDISHVYLMPGKLNENSSDYPYPEKSQEIKDSKKTVEKSGYYTVAYVMVNNNVSSGMSIDYYRPTKFNSVFITKLVDIDKPIISGVKNGGTYSKATIKFSDKHSGIKSAKLDGKTVKSGLKVTKKGTHKLVVTDKSGNTKTVRFKIKK